MTTPMPASPTPQSAVPARRSLELFSGAGGLALGTALAGFHHLALVERNRNACQTLRLNRQAFGFNQDWSVLETDVRLMDYSVYPQDIDLLAGGPPCQPFSLGGKHGGQADDRNLFPEVFRAVRALRPRAVILENVKGLLRTTFRPYFDYIIRQLEYPQLLPRSDETWTDHAARLEREVRAGLRAEYSVRYQLINCADFGVPQRRERVFIVAFRADQGITWKPITPTHSEAALNNAKFVTGKYWQEHRLEPQYAPDPARWDTLDLGQPVQRWRTVRDALTFPVILPEPLDFQESPGFDHHFGNPGARAYPGHTGSPYDLPAKTLKAGDHGVPGGENMLARTDGSVRYFTVREAARLQTFPDAYKFAGAWVECFRQLGNAVPVKLARILAERVADQLETAEAVTRVR